MYEYKFFLPRTCVFSENKYLKIFPVENTMAFASGLFSKKQPAQFVCSRLWERVSDMHSSGKLSEEGTGPEYNQPRNDQKRGDRSDD